MRYEKGNSFKYWGIALLFVGISSAIAGLILVILQGGRPTSECTAVLMILGFAALISIPFGCLCLWKHGVNRIVNEGKKGVCTIEGFETYYFRRMVRVTMTVSFKDKSGNRQTHIQNFDSDIMLTLKEGMHIECYILGDRCRINEHDIKIISDDSLEE